MKKLLCLILLLSGLCNAYAQDILIKKSIFFESDKHKLDNKAEKDLSLLLDSVKANPIKRIIIRGNTDNVGDSIYNIRLSQKRTASCKQYLISKGVQDSIFKTYSWGEDKPIAENDNELGKLKNRRVDILLFYTKPVVPDTAALVSIKNLFRQLEREPERHRINPKRDTLIKGKQGSMVLIRAGSFKLPTDCKDDRVDFLLKEDYLNSDILLDDLSTTSDGKVLESQAMVFTDAEDCQGRKLSLQKGKALTIMTPTDSVVPEAKLFNGMRTPHDSIMNWVLPKNSVIGDYNLRDLFECYQIGCGRGIDCDCPFIPCRVQNFDEQVLGWFDRCKRKENKLRRLELRNCRLKNKGSLSSDQSQRIQNERERIKNRFSNCPDRNSSGVVNPPKCAQLEELFKKYGVGDMTALLTAMNKDLIDSFGVKTLQELYDTMEKIRQKQIFEANKKQMDKYGVTSMQALQDTLIKIQTAKTESDISEGRISYQNLNYYVFNTPKLGWSNVDVFANLDLKNSAQIKLNLNKDTNIDCKLIFKNRRIILPAASEDKKFSFNKIPAGEAVIVVILKYYLGKVYLQIEELISKDTKLEIKLEETDLKTLKERLKGINSL